MPLGSSLRRRPVALAALLVAAVVVGGLGPEVPAASAQGSESGYVTVLEDLPLMPGLAEVAGAGVVFDKPSGRIVEAYARGGPALTRAAVLGFYRKTLPQLGWAEAGAASFRREGEQLEIDFIDAAPDLTLRFTLKPD